ncbi:MAG: ABC transporter permease [Thermodesulfobacteriota bacterium]|nr:MAG: ABC transporter permease [Thermodesulfobacteriota bacterium]
MKQNLKKVMAFIKKDFQEAVSYKLAFLMQVAPIFLSLAIFFFLSKAFGQVISKELERYSGDFFSFVLIGLAFTNYYTLGLTSFSSTIRDAQLKGTLEALLVTPTSLSLIILSSSLWAFFFATLRVLLYLFIGAFFFKAKLMSNYLGAGLILLLTIVAFCAIGILSASFIMVFKRGDPIYWIFGTASAIIGGIYFPISVLPSFLQKCAALLPITYALEAMRLLLLRGYGLEAVWPQIKILILFTLILTPLSMLSFKYAVKVAKKEGSLTQY